ncbi:unnamed protein product [Moneuplotes crassus]|uniref:Fungal lipase-type domain-containing protein n=1 Tax=Euplotes crassus TaxID=5936 RepID=A0AAD1XPG6_EUPCR|nr:unnamed protein product [Moneuplotes crassus]
MLLAVLIKAEYNEQFAKEVFYVTAMSNCEASKIPTGDCGQATKLTNELGMKLIYSQGNGRDVNKITKVIMRKDQDKMLYVAFSGTKNIGQLAQEILQSYGIEYDIHPEVKDAQVMKYFYSKYVEDFRDDFLEEIKKALKLNPGYDVVFTGHSLGGAMAVQALADFMLLGLGEGRKVYGYTFGQPRVGNHQFMDSFIDKVEGFYRVVHNKDLVAHIPPCVIDLSWNCRKDGWLSFYPYHSSQEIWYNDEWADFKRCDEKEGEDSECSNSQFNNSVEDHLNYFNINIGKFLASVISP